MTEAKSASKQPRSDHAGEKSSPELAGISTKSGVEKEQRFVVVEVDNKQLVRELQGDIKEKDKMINKLSEQLRVFTKTAANVEKIVQHSKLQSGQIVKLKKQLEVAEAVSFQCIYVYIVQYRTLCTYYY